MVGEVSKYLMKQYVRGCRDEVLLQKLNLEQKMDSPPSFAMLLLDARKIEAKQTEKNLRLKASAKVAITSSQSSEVSDGKRVRALEYKVSRLEVQLQQQSMSPITDNLKMYPKSILVLTDLVVVVEVRLCQLALVDFVIVVVKMGIMSMTVPRLAMLLLFRKS